MRIAGSMSRYLISNPGKSTLIIGAYQEHIGIMQSENFVNFMLELAKDPSKAEAVLRDPESVLVSANLSQDEKDLVRSRDQLQVQGMLALNLMRDPAVA